MELLFLIIFVFISYASGQESCTTEKTRYGVCTRTDKCPRLLHLAAFIKLGDLHAHIGDCGFDGHSNQRICCPVEEVKCTASTGNIPLPGTCRSLPACPDIERLYSQLPLRVFRNKYGGCEDDNVGNSRWCCPIQAVSDKCTTFKSGKCKRLEDCAALKPLAWFTSEPTLISSYGGECINEKIGDTIICCPTDPLEIAIPEKKCTTFKSGKCQLLEDCAALKPLAWLLDEPTMISIYGGECINDNTGDTMICCPSDPLEITTPGGG